MSSSTELRNEDLSPFTDTKNISTAKQLTVNNKSVSKIELDGVVLGTVTSVNVSKNQLTSCLFLENFAEVTTLNISNNQIEKTKPLRKLHKLRVLNLSHNLVSKSVFISKLRGLVALILNDNKFIELPTLEMPSLNTLLVSKNELTSLDVTRLTSLKKLSFNNNKLSTFPDVSRNTWLETVSGIHNEIEKIPCTHVTTKNSNLKNIELNFNKIGKFKSLEPLNTIQLTKLSLFGNLLLEKEDYRTKVLLICPNLVTLDGQSSNEKVVRMNRPAHIEAADIDKVTMRSQSDEPNTESKSQAEPTAESDTPAETSNGAKKSKEKKKKKSKQNNDNAASDGIAQAKAETLAVPHNNAPVLESKPRKRKVQNEKKHSGVVKIKKLRDNKEDTTAKREEISSLFSNNGSIIGTGVSSW